MWGMTFEKSLRMFSPRTPMEDERAIHQRIAADISECLRLMKKIEAELKPLAQRR